MPSGRSRSSKGVAIFDQYESEDILTASASGVTKFTLSNTGDITFAGGDILGANSAAIDIGEATSGDVEVTGDLLPATDNTYDLGSTTKSWQDGYFTGNLCFDDTDCISAWAQAGTNYWQLNAGTVSPFSSTLDLLVGGTSTASAKFAFLNTLTGLPTASIAGTTANVATFLTGEGTLSTTNMATLTLGGGTTGDIAFQPNGDVNDYLYLNTTSDIPGLYWEGIATTDPGVYVSLALNLATGMGMAPGSLLMIWL